MRRVVTSSKRTAYFETSVASYLTARPTGDLLAAWQKSTIDWWESRRSRFDLYTSKITIEEAGRGDPQAAARRAKALEGTAVLPITTTVVQLAVALLRQAKARCRETPKPTPFTLPCLLHME